MAQLTQPTANSFEIGPLAPAGTYLATCLDVNDQFGVERPKFENPQEMETLDVTRFLFGFIGQDGQSYKVQSFEFRISGSPKSNLFKFLTTWLGHPPKYGWDYCEMKGQGAMLTVAHKPSRDGSKTYANLVGISPVIAQLRDQVPPLSAFQISTAAPAATPNGYPTPPPQSSQPQQAPQPPAPTQHPQTHSAHSAPSAVNPTPQPAPWDPSIHGEDNCPF